MDVERVQPDRENRIKLIQKMSRGVAATLMNSIIYNTCSPLWPSSGIQWSRGEHVPPGVAIRLRLSPAYFCQLPDTV